MKRKLSAVGAAVFVIAALAGCTANVATTDVREITLHDGGVVTCIIAGATSGSPAISCDWDHVKTGE